MARPARARTRGRRGGAASNAKPRRTSTPAAGGAANEPSVRIRLYCQGIGDCHLLRFRKPNGFFWMLIDCGVHSAVTGGTETINHIVDDIRGLTDRLDVIVLTHEHSDHVSGFSTALEKFKGFKIGEVWAAWTENSKDPQAAEFDKFKGEAFDALRLASQRLDEARHSSHGLSPHLSAVQQGLGAVLSFNFGAQGERVRAARDAFLALGKGHVKFLEPKTPPFQLGGETDPVMPSVRVYVLGPPREADLLKITERPSEMYGLGVAGRSLAAGLNSSFKVSEGLLPAGFDINAPFDSVDGFLLTDFQPSDSAKPASAATPMPSGSVTPASAATAIKTTLPDEKTKLPDETAQAEKDEAQARNRTAKLLRERYDASDQDWRRIDNDWLGVSADLAIQLDKRTNNSSLVLAFEFVDTKRVLLFVGDAQVGNWLSWKDVSWKIGDATVTAHDLLARTVFYKVGHHGSHNATLKQNGLELMTSPLLAAFIPTNREDAKKVKWDEMPFEPLLDELNKRAQKRVVRADDKWFKQPGSGSPPEMINAAIGAWRHDTGPDKLWVEFDFK